MLFYVNKAFAYKVHIKSNEPINCSGIWERDIPWSEWKKQGSGGPCPGENVPQTVMCPGSSHTTLWHSCVGLHHVHSHTAPSTMPIDESGAAAAGAGPHWPKERHSDPLCPSLCLSFYVSEGDGCSVFVLLEPSPNPSNHICGDNVNMWEKKNFPSRFSAAVIKYRWTAQCRREAQPHRGDKLPKEKYQAFMQDNKRVANHAERYYNAARLKDVPNTKLWIASRKLIIFALIYRHFPVALWDLAS